MPAPSSRAGPRVEPTLACSSAGGGLRLAVVGYERVVTAEAGQRVGLSAGARVVHVAAGAMTAADLGALLASRPDVVLLVGGTDGGNAEILRHNAEVMAAGRLEIPVVLAGNVDARDEVTAVLRAAGVPVTATDNVLPRDRRAGPDAGPGGDPGGVHQARHRRQGLSRRADFPAMVRGATPDVVLAGVELLADAAGWSRAPATCWSSTSAARPPTSTPSSTPTGEDAVLRKEVVEVLWRSRTVEGDLGMRWGATGVVEAACAERLLEPGEEAGLRAAAAARVADPAYLPDDDAGRDDDARLAGLAVTVALRRHGRGGKDLREVALVVGSGGVLRHATTARAARVLAPATTDLGGGWAVPEHARTVTDVRYVLAAAGLLAAEQPQTAAALVSAALGV